MEDLLLSLEVADETDTELSIRNIGVLMFTDRPDRFIPGAQIDLVKFNTEEAEGSDDFLKKLFMDRSGNRSGMFLIIQYKYNRRKSCQDPGTG